MPSRYIPYTRGIAEQIIKARGISTGEDDSEKTTKKIWTEAEARAISDTRANREVAYEIDALVNIILEFEAFTILGSYKIHSSDDEKHSELIQNIDSLINDVNIIGAFREAFPGVRIHGGKYLQKIYDTEQTRLESESKQLTSLQQLVAVEKHENPFKSDDYYLFQNLKIPKDWKNPESTEDKPQKVWYIKDGPKGVDQYKEISITKQVQDPNDADGDIVVDLIDIVEIKNNESGRSSLTPALNEIFIKNHIILNLPNLVYLVLAPGIWLEHQTHDKDGNWMVPHYPSASLESSNPDEYAQQKKDYEAFEAEKQTIANTLIESWFKKGIIISSDMMKPNVLESKQIFQSEMLKLMMTMLNKEIAFALGFPIALLDAHGTELATGREIRAVLSAALKGIQNQYQKIALDIIYEQFPNEAEEAGITFEFTELNPQDAKTIAEVREMDAKILKIYWEIGASVNDLRAWSAQSDLLDDPEFGGEGMVKGIAEAEAPYSAEDLGVSMDIIRRITEDRKAVGIEAESFL